MNFFSDNLKYLREKAGMEQIDLAKKLGKKSSSSISEWESGKYTPKSGTLADIAEIFKVSLSDLMQTNLKDELSLSKPTNLIEIQPKFVKVPILGTIACGDPILAEENFKGYRYELADTLPSGNVIILEAQGDSMEPTIPDGSFVIVREQPDVENGEIAAVRVNGNTEATLKRIKKQGNTILLMPDNPRHDPIVVDEDNPISIIGKAVKVTWDL